MKHFVVEHQEIVDVLVGFSIQKLNGRLSLLGHLY